MPPWVHLFRRYLRKRNSRLLDLALIGLAQMWGAMANHALPSPIRAVISGALSQDPLRNETDLPPIDVAIPFVEKDVAVLPWVVASAIQKVRNPIRFIHLITPADHTRKQPLMKDDTSLAIVENILKTTKKARLLFDHKLVGEILESELSANLPGGWVTQQLVKFSVLMQPDAIPTLILDSDTVLLHEKTWLAGDDRQLLQVAHEFDTRYREYIRVFFSLKKRLPLSFVTHHQLMHPLIVNKMFPSGPKSLKDWWLKSQAFPEAFLSEFEAYGSFIYEMHRERVNLGGWSNLLSPSFARFSKELEASEKAPEKLIPDYCSVSFHAHAQTPPDTE